MSMPNLDVPIIGSPAEAFSANLQVIIRCKCKPDNPPFLVAATDAQCRCNHCGKVYIIAAAEFNLRRNIPLKVTVALVAQVQSEGTQQP